VQVDALSLTLAPREVSALIMSLPLPQGINLSDVTLRDSGLELTVRASFLFNFPVKFKVEVRSYAGSRISFKVTPPIKPNWLVIRPLISCLPGAMYAGHSVIEVDLVSLSKGYLTSITVQNVVLNRTGVRVDVTGIKSKISWDEIVKMLLHA
jgi:hypothetical protein